MTNIWKKIKRPILALAPMLDVSDSAFRQVVVGRSKPSLLFTEFVSVDGLCHPKSKDKLIKHYLLFDKKKERPIIAQIWGADPAKFFTAAKIIKKLGFDGIDINMGCPDKKVIKSGGGAGLILNPKLANEIISKTKEGGEGIPVSVKTRIGYDKNTVEKWIERLSLANPDAITIHGRTKKEMSRVPADWKSIQLGARIAQGFNIPVLGNGDISSFDDAEEKIKKYNLDGIMIGRAALRNPWIFKSGKFIPTIEDRIELTLEHARLFEKTFVKAEIKRFHHLRKFFANYIAGFEGSKELRVELMKALNYKDVEKIIKLWRKKAPH